LRYGSEAIFLAKKLSDEVFDAGDISDEIKKYAIEKYNSLCEISLN
jgi:hypothetical protein